MSDLNKIIKYFCILFCIFSLKKLTFLCESIWRMENLMNYSGGVTIYQWHGHVIQCGINKLHETFDWEIIKFLSCANDVIPFNFFSFKFPNNLIEISGKFSWIHVNALFSSQNVHDFSLEISLCKDILLRKVLSVAVNRLLSTWSESPSNEHFPYRYSIMDELKKNNIVYKTTKTTTYPSSSTISAGRTSLYFFFSLFFGKERKKRQNLLAYAMRLILKSDLYVICVAKLPLTYGMFMGQIL